MGRSIAALLLAMVQVASADTAVGGRVSGWVAYVAFDDDLVIRSSDGVVHEAEFSRQSQAFDDELNAFPANEPRFASGRFGRGVMMEPGFESSDKLEARNYLSPAAAQMLTTAESPAPYIPLGGAGMEAGAIDSAAVGAAPSALARHTRQLAVHGNGAGSGVETREAVNLIRGAYAVSCYLRGPADIRMAVIDTNGVAIGEGVLPAAGEWARREMLFSTGAFTRDRSQQAAADFRIRFLTTVDKQVFHLAGVVLEMNGGYSYAGARGAGSWLPGRGYRASEALDLAALSYAWRGRTGSVAFWANLRGVGQVWRTLFELGGENRWQPQLQLSLRRDHRLYLSGHSGTVKEVSAAVETPPGAWRHYAVTWTNDRAVAYLDGEPLLHLEGLDVPISLAAVRLGSAGPNAAANAVVDETVLYDRVLAPEEVAALCSRSTPLSDESWPVLTLRPDRFIRTVARTRQPQPWSVLLSSSATNALRNVSVEFGLGDHIRLLKSIPLVDSGETLAVTFDFVPDLEGGLYAMRVTASAPGCAPSRFAAEVEITPMAEPGENLQVSSWGMNSLREYGLTCGGGSLEEAMREGLYWAPLVHYLGYPRAVEGEDWVLGMNDQPFRAKLTSPYLLEQIAREGERLSRQYAATPAMRAVTLNSEMQWIWQHDFSPERMDWIRATFGLDLTPWRYPPAKGGVDAFQHPFGRLRPSVGGIGLPESRIVPTKMPFYAYHRWFHGPSGPTESCLNQRLSEAIVRRRPDLWTIQEPILRRADLRAFDRMSLAQEWFYYEDPMSAVMVQERLNAAVRGTRMRPTGMPQFLFKAGLTAPYNATPTADLYRETAWLCAMQPIRMFTYWNFEAVPRAGFENAYYRCMPQAELDAFFGSATPTWEAARRAMDADPKTAGRIMPWSPGLIEAFRRFHTEEMGPLGGLIPAWRNHPRRVAVLRSFASQLFDNIRWRHTSGLEHCAVRCGVPFDVLYDEDFEAGSDPLATHQLLVVSQTVCLTEPVYRQILAFLQRGGTVVADPETLVELPGAVRIEGSGALQGYQEQLAAQEAEARKRHGGVSDPQYVEAIERWAQSAAGTGSVEPAFLSVLEERVQVEARSMTPNTWLNLLTAEGAHYVAVVNDLRTWGPMYGHFGKVREQGVPQTAEVVYDPDLGSVAYDLLRHERLEVVRKGDRLALALALPPAGGRLVMLLDRPIGNLTAEAGVHPAVWGEQPGREARLSVRLADDAGEPVQGLVPVSLSIVRPDGVRSDYSCHTILRGGSLEYAFPLPAGGAPGVWRIVVLERASGRTVEVELPDPGVPPQATAPRAG